MPPELFLLVVATGSAALALWLSVRLDLTAASARAAFLCFATAWLLPGLAAPLVTAGLPHLRPGLAILVGVLPVLTAAFVCAAACLRFLVERLRHA